MGASDVHVIGFSLGGQLVAFIGQQTNGALARITGLDPAGFLSHTAPPEEKLSPDDAQFVDVIHSAGLWMGTDEKMKILWVSAAHMQELQTFTLKALLQILDFWH